MTVRVWRVPVLLALATLAGLFLALTGGGTRDGIAAVALALPVAAAAFALAARQR